jgi:very-short-patch-repair endonuclease
MPVRKFRCLRKYAKPWKQRFANKLRRNMTFPERLLWSKLKNKQLGICAYSQKIVLGYILDFWLPAAGLCVEVDGPCHNERKGYDAKRDAVLREKKIRTLRFTAQEVNNNLNAVVSLIHGEVVRRLK